VRAIIVASLGGLIIGHMLWLTAISLATKSTTVNAWVLVIAVASLLLAAACGLLGRMFRARKAFAKAAFLWCLPVSPLLFSISVLAVTYV
jgi:magnesium-transporting ATPase (P-type)